MNYLIFDPETRCCVGTLDGEAQHFSGGTLVSVDTLPQDLSALVLTDDGGFAQDVSLVLARAQAVRIAAIKTETAALIEATHWRLERAREREEAGFDGERVADVLAEREAIRQASNRAEARVLAMTDPAAVRDFTWSLDHID